MDQNGTVASPIADIPADALTRVTLGMIDEGRLIGEVDAAIETAHAGLQRFAEKFQDRSKSSVVTLQITLSYDPDVKDGVMIESKVSTKVPVGVRESVALEKGGKLLCKPSGATGDSLDQLELFTRAGAPLGTVNPRTGEWTAQDGAVAGSIGVAAS